MARAKTSQKENSSSVGNSNAGQIDGSVKINMPTNSIIPSNQEHMSFEMVYGLSGRIHDLENRINGFEKGQEKQEGLFLELTRLSKASRHAITFLLLVPIMQLIVCVIIVHLLGIQEKLNSLLNWFLGGISILSISEMVYLPINLNNNKKRIEELEKKVQSINDKNT